MALDVMTHHALVDEETPLNIEEHRWDKSNHRPLPKTEARSSKVSSLYVHDEITGTLRIQNQIRQSE